MANLLPVMTGKSTVIFLGSQADPGPRDGADAVRVAAACKTAAMRITVLAGGVGGARFLRGLLAAAPDAEITVIGNTGDDITLFGLHVSPDLDTVMYTLGGGISEEQGWGRDQETFTVLHELAAYGLGPDWFSLGDRDFATHIARTAMLTAGLPLSAATRRPVRTLAAGRDPAADVRRPGRDPRPDRRRPGPRTVHFQEWWVRLHAAVPARRDHGRRGGGRPRPRRACWRRSRPPTSSCCRRPTRW